MSNKNTDGTVKNRNLLIILGMVSIVGLGVGGIEATQGGFVESILPARNQASLPQQGTAPSTTPGQNPTKVKEPESSQPAPTILPAVEESASSALDWKSSFSCLGAFNRRMIQEGATPGQLALTYEVESSIHLPTEEGLPEEMRYRGKFLFPDKRVLYALCAVGNVETGYTQVMFPAATNPNQWGWLTESNGSIHFEAGEAPKEDWLF